MGVWVNCAGGTFHSGLRGETGLYEAGGWREGKNILRVISCSQERQTKD